MYKYLKMSETILKVFLSSLVLSLAMSQFGGFSFSYVFIGMLIANASLTASYKYTIEVDRPVVFTIVFVFYICLAGYSREYSGYSINAQGFIRYLLRVETPYILMASCVSVLIINIEELWKVIKPKVDSWFIPMYVVVIAAFIIIEINDWVMLELKQISYFFLSMGITVICLYAGEKKQQSGIRYHINTKGYLGYMSLLLVILVLGGMYLPKPEYLPGAKWFQEQVFKFDLGVSTTTRLNRKPSMSEEILYRVDSDKALYLRSIAYSDYIGDSWSVDLNDVTNMPLDFLEFDHEYAVCYSMLQDKRRAYVYEEKSSDNYLTTNGTYKIEVDDTVQSMGDINNICFSEGTEGDSQRGYTIKYHDRIYSDKLKTVIGNTDRGKWDYFVKNMSKTYKEDDDKYVDLKYNLDTEEYWELYDKYTQIPQELYAPFYNLASEIVGPIENQVEAARAIEDYLKYTGGYRYAYGARKKDRLVDTVYDFTFNGKEGICQDFASSMTLLCRSIGLPSRYVGGYYSEEVDEQGRYVVRGKHAHAFVEVYITGYGWMLFDPTTGVTEQTDGLIQDSLGVNGVIDTSDNGVLQDSILRKQMIYPILILIAAWFIFKISYKIYWTSELLKKDSGTAIVIIYKKTKELLESIDSDEDNANLRQRALNIGVDIYPIIYPYEQYYYGDKYLSQEQIKEALATYNKLLRNRLYIKRT